jgi:FMN phosphatase YigB (HAD superfamily)
MTISKTYADPKKVILTDCDGVLLDWEYSFKVWMFHKGYPVVNNGEYKMDVMFNLPREVTRSMIRQFNESAAIGFLPPLRDAVHYVRKLHDEHGIVFHCLTSLSNDASAQKLRQMNLDKVFGKGIFEKLICADTGADKHEILEPYRDSGCLWIEDKPENAVLGQEMGLNPILMGHDHNQSFKSDTIPRVWKWQHVYSLVELEEDLEGKQ